jgi:hypothetical protein
MCGDPNGWMCDECFGKMRSLDRPMEREDFCPTCQHEMDHLCFCCGVRQDTPTGEEGICAACAAESM